MKRVTVVYNDEDYEELMRMYGLNKMNSLSGYIRLKSLIGPGSAVSPIDTEMGELPEYKTTSAVGELPKKTAKKLADLGVVKGIDPKDGYKPISKGDSLQWKKVRKQSKIK